MKFHIHTEGGKVRLPAFRAALLAIVVCMICATYATGKSSTLTGKPLARTEPAANHQKPHLAEQLASTSPLPPEPSCTAAQTDAWQTAESSLQYLALKTASATWLKANECTPVNVTQLPRPADQTMVMGTITWPDGRVLSRRVTSHMIWNGIPGKVTLTPTQEQTYLQAAITPAAMLVYCCDRSTGPIYTDGYWHCSANNFTSKFYDTSDQLVWSMNTFAQYCTNYTWYGGAVVNWDSRIGPVGGAPVHVSSCKAYVTTDGWAQACVPPMHQSGYYKQFSGDVTIYGSYVADGKEEVEDQFGPMLGTYCYLGDERQELHIHRNHGVAWAGLLTGRDGGLHVCVPPLHTITG